METRFYSLNSEENKSKMYDLETDIRKMDTFLYKGIQFWTKRYIFYWYSSTSFLKMYEFTTYIPEKGNITNRNTSDTNFKSMCWKTLTLNGSTAEPVRSVEVFQGFNCSFSITNTICRHTFITV